MSAVTHTHTHLMDVISDPVMPREAPGLSLMKLWTVEIEAETWAMTRCTSHTRDCDAETTTSDGLLCFLLTCP